MLESDNIAPKKSKLEFLEMLDDRNPPIHDFFTGLVNRKLAGYKAIIQTGGKAGQSYFSHVMDIVMTIERLKNGGIIALTDPETRCLYLACVVHDMNKVPPYASTTKRYTEMMNETTVAAELTKLEADHFFPDWHDYLTDIVKIAELHQGSAAVTNVAMDLTRSAPRMRESRIKALGWIIQAADVLDMSHGLEERKHKLTFLATIHKAGLEKEWTFVSHRLSENRGLLTNLIHNQVVKHIRSKGGVDLLYYPEGVAYLLPKGIELDWSEADLTAVATLVKQRIAKLQSDELSQFIKPRPAGIKIDSAALESGAQPSELFEVVMSIVLRKSYKAEWIEARDTNVRGDLAAALDKPGLEDSLKTLVVETLERANVVPTNEESLRRGELLAAYRNYLEDHLRERLGKALPWDRVYTLFGLPPERKPFYDLIDAFRRGYFLASELSMSLDDMHAAILEDLQSLQPSDDEEDAPQLKDKPEPAKRRGKQADPEDAAPADSIASYLMGNLSVSGGKMTAGQLSGELRRYVSQNHKQCSNCSTRSITQEWMAANAPGNIGVQSFSNRLEGGSPREPKRNICAICRTQFILEKLAWKGHRDKQGSEQTTFYLHLFPYSFFTETLLTAWFGLAERLRNMEIEAFFVRAEHYFRDWVADAQSDTPPLIQSAPASWGVAVPQLAESLGNTPVLPVQAKGQNYGEQFVQALETAAILARFLGCRVLMSRTPVPLLTLTGSENLVVDGMPRNMSWLVEGGKNRGRQQGNNAQTGLGSSTTLSGDDFKALMKRLSHLHKLRDELWFMDYKGSIVHDLAAVAADDELSLYSEADRIMERKLSKAGSKGSPELQAIEMSRRMLPWLDGLRSE